MFKNLLAVVIGIGLILSVVEAGARILANVVGISSYMKYDEQLGWIAVPDTIKHHTNAYMGFDVTYTINRKGFRGPVYDEQKPLGIYRVVVLGDSNGFGWGIPENQTFSALIRERMKNVEVVNLSLSGYGTDQEYLRFLKEGVAYKPDLVIVQVTPNDFEEIQHPFFNQQPKPQFAVSDEGVLKLLNVPVKPVGAKCQEFYDNSLPLPFKDWLGWHSYAYNFFNEKYYSLKRKFAPSRSAEPNPERFSKKSVALFNRIILELKGTLDGLGAKGLVVHASKDLSEHNYLANSSLPVLDLYPKFLSYTRADSAELFYKDGYHWNIEGNRIVAEELIKIIESFSRGSASISGE